MPNRPAPPLIVDSELATLRSLTRAGRTEQRLATRARIVLAAAAGMPNNRIAGDVGGEPDDRPALAAALRGQAPRRVA